MYDLIVSDEVLKAISQDADDDDPSSMNSNSARANDSIVLKYKELIREQVCF